MNLDLSKHPCFNKSAKTKFGRIHLPVAPKCNIQCNFCDRKFDCVNESRPGVTSAILSPHQSIAYLDKMMQRDNRLSVVGIAGPGDPFANAEQTMATLRMVREKYPEMLLCVASNGLNAADYVEEMARLNVSHLTLTINAIDPAVGAQIYSWIRDGKKVHRSIKGARLLLARQLKTLRLAKKHNLVIKVNTILIPGINDHHVGVIAEKVSRLGVNLFNCIPMCSVPGTVFESIEQPTSDQLEQARSEAKVHIPQMLHCTRCRADAVGCLGESVPKSVIKTMQKIAAGPLNPQEKRPYIAVATKEGLLINEHLGRAKNLWVFGKDGEDGYKLIETRQTPPGGGDIRWRQLSGILRDCRCVLVQAAGPKPTEYLANTGVKVYTAEGLIEQGLEYIYKGYDIEKLKPKCSKGCCANAKGCG